MIAYIVGFIFTFTIMCWMLWDDFSESEEKEDLKH